MMNDPREALNNVRTESSPSDLKITDIRFADIWGAPMQCILMKVYTNQGLVGYGEVRDFADKRYALMLKSRLISPGREAAYLVLRSHCGILPARRGACLYGSYLAENIVTKSACTATRTLTESRMERRWERH